MINTLLMLHLPFKGNDTQPPMPPGRDLPRMRLYGHFPTSRLIADFECAGPPVTLWFFAAARRKRFTWQCPAGFFPGRTAEENPASCKLLLGSFPPQPNRRN